MQSHVSFYMYNLIQGRGGRIDPDTQRRRQCEDAAQTFEDTGLENWMIQPQTKERSQQAPEAGRGEEQMLPECLRREHVPAHILSLGLWY